MNVHLNPSNGQFTVNGGGTAFRVEMITDLLGRTVAQPASLTSDRAVIELGGNPQGIYIAHLLTGDGQRLHVRLMLQK